MRGLLLVCLLPLAVGATESPRDLLARAIAAHGGAERLTADRAERVQLRGVHFAGATEVPFTNTLTLHLPGRYKSAVTLGKSTVTNVLDGDRAALLVDGRPQKMSEAQLGQLRQTLALNQTMRLVPLLRDKGVSLTALGEYTIQGVAVVGIAVRRTGLPDVKLFFDKRTALLRASEQVLEAPGTAPIVQQARYSDHRDAGGYVRPGKITVFRDGKKVMEAVLTEARSLEKIDPDEFRIPTPAPQGKGTSPDR